MSSAAAARRLLPPLLFLLSLGVAGCASRPVGGMPPARLQAIAHNDRGVARQAEGDADLALDEFRQALRLHGSIENTGGMAVSLVNIARTQRLKGDLRAAREALVRAEPLLAENPGLAPELEFEKAKILLAQGELAAARDCAARAEAAEGEGRGAARANLLALILFRMGAPARAQAEKALQRSRAEGAAAEEANALRLLGELERGEGNLAGSTQRLLRALQLDKELGLGRKIALDLRGLGANLAQGGEPAAAARLYRRAQEVSLNGGDAASAAQDLRRLAELCRQAGAADPRGTGGAGEECRQFRGGR